MNDEYRRLREFYEDISGQLDVAAGTGDTTLVAAKTRHTIFLQRVRFSVTTDAAQSMSIENSDASKQAALVPSSPGTGVPYPFDFGARGMSMGEGLGLVMNVSAAGLAGPLIWEGYRKLTGVGAP